VLVLLAACGRGTVNTPAKTLSPSPAIDALAFGAEATTGRGSRVTVLGWREVERDERPPDGTAWSYAEVRYCQPHGTSSVPRGPTVAFFRLDMPEGPDVHPVERADGAGELATGQTNLITESMCMEGNVVFAHPAGQRPDHVLFTVGELAWAVA
ncbi:MAG: hypothetical protein WD770_03355, partial [Actinomycetota bacterium]